MVKVTFEENEFKREASGKCVFAVVIEPEDDADIAAALIGETSPYDLIDVIGKATGAQIAKIVPDNANKIKLIELLGKSVAKGVFRDLEIREGEALVAEADRRNEGHE